MERRISAQSPASSSSPHRSFALPRMQELGLVVVILILGTILSIYGYYDARPGEANTFLNFDNLIDGIATPMSYYAIMAVGVTMVIVTGGIDISVGSMLALPHLWSLHGYSMLVAVLEAWYEAQALAFDRQDCLGDLANHFPLLGCGEVSADALDLHEWHGWSSYAAFDHSALANAESSGVEAR